MTDFNEFGEKRVEIFIRLFPELSFNQDLIEIYQNQVIHLNFCDKNKTIQFVAEHVFVNESQEGIFSRVFSKSDFDKFLSGVDLIVFVVGQQNSGKSVTLNGLKNNSQYEGIIPRVLKKLIKIITEENKLEFECKLSLLDFKEKSVHDLLNFNQKINFKYHSIKMENIEKYPEIMKKLNTNQLNESNRVLTVSLNSKSGDNFSKIHFIEMSGFDKNRRFANMTKFHFKQFLKQLKDTLMTDEQIEQIFRLNSLLEFLKKNYLKKKRLIPHVKVNSIDLKMTQSTMQFVQMFYERVHILGSIVQFNYVFEENSNGELQPVLKDLKYSMK